MAFTRIWTGDEDRILERNWRKRVPDAQIAADLERSTGAVERRRVTLGLVSHNHIQKTWTELELLRLHHHFAVGTRPAAIAKKLGRSFWSVYMAMRREGLA